MPTAGGLRLRYAKDTGIAYLMKQTQAGLSENNYLLPGSIQNFI
jgi:hypothetical protein